MFKVNVSRTSNKCDRRKKSWKLRLTKRHETRNYFVERIKHNYLISEKDENVCIDLNYTVNSLVSNYAITVCSSISPVALLVGIFIGVAASALGIAICALNSFIKNSKSIIKKKNERKYDKIILLVKTVLDTTGVLMSKFLIYSDISYDKFILVYNILKEYTGVKKKKSKFLKRINSVNV